MYNDNGVAIFDTLTDNIQTKRKKKAMMKLKIRIKKGKYISTLSTSTDTTT